jgi:hypothetical protein
MPNLNRPGGVCVAIFNPPSKPIRGIPLQYFVRPVSRQGGVYTDQPKGFELPGCMVDPCCEEIATLTAVLSIGARECSDDVVYTLTITNTGPAPLHNLTLVPVSLVIAGAPILTGDSEIVLPATPELLAGGSIVLTETVGYTLPLEGFPIAETITLAAGDVSSDEGVNALPTSVEVDLCAIVV